MREECDLIKLMLLKHALTQRWLIHQLNNMGIVIGKTELSSILAGARKGPKSEAIVRNAVVILREYEKRFGALPPQDLLETPPSPPYPASGPERIILINHEVVINVCKKRHRCSAGGSSPILLRSRRHHERRRLPVG